MPWIVMIVMCLLAAMAIADLLAFGWIMNANVKNLRDLRVWHDSRTHRIARRPYGAIYLWIKAKARPIQEPK